MDLLIGLVLVFLALAPDGARRRGAVTTWELVFFLLLGASLVGVLAPESSNFVMVVALGGCTALLLPRLLRAPSGVSRTRPQHRSPASAGINQPLWLALILTAWLFLRNAIGPGVSTDTLLGFSASLLLLGFAFLIRSRANVQMTPATVGRLLMLFLGVAILIGVVRGGAWIPCRAGKCSVAHQLYRGIFVSENSVALYAAAAASFAVSARRSALKWPRVAVLLVVIAVTGSRTAMIALAAGLLAALALASLARRREDLFRLHRGWSALSAIGIVGVGMYLVVTAQATSFSSRGHTWSAARAQLGGLGSLAGLGTARWPQLEDVGLLPEHFPHSQVLHIVFGGGLIALALYVLLIRALLAERGGVTRLRLAALIAPVLVFGFLGLTEVVWNPATVDTNVALLFALLVVDYRDSSTGRARGQESAVPISTP